MPRTSEAESVPDAAPHGAPQTVADSAVAYDSPESELMALAAAVRGRLRQLEASGVGAVPRSRGRVARVPPSAGATPRVDSVPPPVAPPVVPTSGAAVPQRAPAGPVRAEDRVIEHAPPMVVLPPATPPRPAPPARSQQPAPGRGPMIVETSYAELPAPGALVGPAGLVELRRLLGDCRRCKLCHGRNNLVFEDGNPEALLAFVGEGPGADEDRLGRPFVGAAGQLLDRMIDAMAGEAEKRGYAGLAPRLSRSAVYICNVVKCRPPGNRTPELDEMGACSPFLRRQLEALRPSLRVIVALGRTPTQYLLRTTAPISSLRGNFSAWEGIPVMPTYHPAYLLRTPSAKRQVWEDLQKVIDALAEGAARPRTAASPAITP